MQCSDRETCVFFLARLPSWEQVNTGRVASCEARLMSLLKPLGCNWRFAGIYATLPIYYSSFHRRRQNQFQLKPALAKTGTHSWTGEMGRDSQRQLPHGLPTSPRGAYQFEPEVGSTWALEPGGHGEAFQDPFVKARIMHWAPSEILYFQQITN